jgi:hypothetical protein
MGIKVFDERMSGRYREDRKRVQPFSDFCLRISDFCVLRWGHRKTLNPHPVLDLIPALQHSFGLHVYSFNKQARRCTMMHPAK